MILYKDIFEAVENTLIEYGSRNKVRNEVESKLNVFKHFEGRILSDNDFYEILVFVTFYSGFKAATVTAKRDIILKHFPDWETVSTYSEKNIDQIMNDDQMIRNKIKIEACIYNAIQFKKILNSYKSFHDYIKSFNPESSFENLVLLKEELEVKFKYLGSRTVYHFLTDIGMPVLKPDRVLCRIFKRLGLIESDKQLLKTVIHGRKFSEATNLPIRYIDIVFVAYGQAHSEEFGIDRGICLKNPRCEFCNISTFCHYDAKNA